MSSATPVANKNRSPNYPSIGLAEAIEKIKTVYAKHRQYTGTRDVIAKALGYGGVNGASATVISALSKYGLIEGYGEKLKVSDIGRDLSLHRRGDPEYAEALRAAASMPAFFREMNQQYPEGLPDSEHIVRAWLVKRGFNDRAIGNAVRAYRDTIEFVNSELEEDGIGSSDHPREETAMHTQVDNPSRGFQPPFSGLPADTPLKTVQLPLSIAEWATLQAAFPLSETAWNQMMAVLTAMKPALVAPADPPEQAAGGFPGSSAFDQGANQTLPRNGADGSDDA